MTATPPPAHRSLVTALGRLRATPPAGFAEQVFDRLGLLAAGDAAATGTSGVAAADGFALVDGPAGPLFVAFNHRGVVHVLAADLLDEDGDRFAAEHRLRFGREARPSRPPPGLAEAVRTGRGPGLAYDLAGLSELERAVLRAALEIPPGELRPYVWVAREIGRPKAVRAVGSALGRNPVPVLIPCHRVVRSDGQLGGYVFGTEWKRALLAAEAVDLGLIERLARAGQRFVGHDATREFCYPTCHNAPHEADPHRVLFSRADQARRAGYQPCVDCRPDVRQSA